MSGLSVSNCLPAGRDVAVGSAKHLDTPDEVLHALAGSFGYVAPEVLMNKGHSKAVDIWSTGYAMQPLVTVDLLADHLGVLCTSRIITYVLLCGYSPFRSDDIKALVAETTKARIVFHETFWKNVSDEGWSRFRESSYPLVLL